MVYPLCSSLLVVLSSIDVQRYFDLLVLAKTQEGGECSRMFQSLLIRGSNSRQQANMLAYGVP